MAGIGATPAVDSSDLKGRNPPRADHHADTKRQISLGTKGNPFERFPPVSNPLILKEPDRSKG